MQSFAALPAAAFSRPPAALPDRRCDGATTSCQCTMPAPKLRSHRRRPVANARKAGGLQDWEALANAYQDPDDVSADTAQQINQVCNSGLRHMLRGDGFKVERFKDELSELGNRFGEQGHKQGATFIYVLYKVAEHVLPPEHEKLQGTWASSFTKFFGVLEDSGWRVKREGEEEDEDEDDVDISDILPNPENGYFQQQKIVQ